MAINSLEICNKIKPKYSDSINSGNSVSNITKITVTTESSISASSKCKKSKNQYSKLPYLKGDKVQLLSRVTEKRLIRKLEPNYVSSFPLAATIYRVNSDKIRPLKRSNKKNKKSVLTLPNEQSRLPETCTVSEMNDSEYCNRDDKNKKAIKKKRTPLLNKRKSRKNNFEFYDRDARYCSQMNIDLDCSSSDILNQFNGDGRKLSKKSSVAIKPSIENECNAHVWTVLRNINRFQFRPSPPMSNDSNRSSKKKKYINRRCNNRKDARVIDTCRTEEIAYMSSYDIDSKSATNFSPLSSCDRVTVIDKQGEFSKIGKEFENKTARLQNTVTPTNNMRNRNLLRNNIFGTKSMKGKEKENKISNQLVPIGNGVETHIDNLKLNVSQDHKVPLGTKINMATDNSMSYNSDQLSLYVCANNPNNLNNTKKNKQKTHKSVGLVDSFMYSEQAGSSKAGLHNTVDYRRDKNKLDKVSSDESSHDKKAITRVVPNKNSNIVVSRNRKPRLITTMPTTSIVPKLTQTDIKRRLMNLKYPITILGKDQLSSSPINLENYEQFQGLDQHIWPFMVDWYDQNTVNDRSENKLKHSLNKVESLIQRNNQKLRSGGSVILTRQTDREVFLNNANNIKSKMIYNLDDSLRKKKIDYQPNATIETTNNIKLSQIKNIKPMRQLNDKVFKLLYKKSSTQSMTYNNYQQIGGQGDEKSRNNTNVSTKVTIRKKVDASTETIMKYNINEIFPITPSISSQLLTNLKRPLNTNYPWAKGKRTSDLIENVIKNIKNGIYYNQENIETVKSSCVEFKEASVQTTMVALRIGSTNTINKEEKTIKSLETVVLNSETDNLQRIPGFDTALPALEIKTLNTKEIAVKHCITNVMIQFDVTIPIEQDTVCLDVRKSFSFIPLKVTDSHTRLYKSKTTILNAMLPAELCCIIPKMISNISNVETKFTFSPALLDKSESQLSTISELIHCKNPDVFKTFIPSSLNVSTKLEKLFTGYFAKPFKSEIKKVNYTLSHNVNLATELLDVLQISSMFPCMLKRLTPENYSKQKQKPNSMLVKPYVETPPKKSSCSTLQPYVASKHSLIQNSAMNNFINILTKIWNYNKFKNYNIISENDGKIIYLPFAVNKLKIDAIYNSISKYNNKALELGAASYYTTPRCIEYKPQEKKECSLNKLFYNKGKKKHFIKLYRKCKSTSNISAERSTTSLCKIANIDDFFQALGLGKLISNVFDGSVAKKILSCVIEMKNWITEISQRQAMLILLLINKKDTPILVRFRPVLLQGIAVNRITRASELDMELEVIERENFNKLSECEGISYLTPSIENHDNLLEELYWIAKTTASDYQIPFEESSERLLKSLLEKRKKLNPSYLRVMARYVGLGLLKSPNKK